MDPTATSINPATTIRVGIRRGAHGLPPTAQSFGAHKPANRQMTAPKYMVIFAWPPYGVALSAAAARFSISGIFPRRSTGQLAGDTCKRPPTGSKSASGHRTVSSTEWNASRSLA